MRGMGAIGVLHDQYEPAIQGLAKERQAGIREHLQNLHRANAMNWTEASLMNDLTSSYELQREDILMARKKVNEEANKSASEDDVNEENELDAPVRVPALQELKNLWPCLFTLPGIECHHFRLTGRNIRPALQEFRDEHLHFLLLFMTSNSASNTKNLALRLKCESAGHLSRFEKDMLTLFMMVANHFQENWEGFLKTAEVQKIHSSN